MCILACGNVGAQHPFNFIVFWCCLAAFIIINMGPKKLFPPYELFHDTSSVVEQIKLVCRGMTIHIYIYLKNTTVVFSNLLSFLMAYLLVLFTVVRVASIGHIYTSVETNFYTYCLSIQLFSLTKGVEDLLLSC